MSLPRLAIICDMAEESWPSMDLVAEMLFSNLQQAHADTLRATLIRPPMRRRLTKQRSEVGSQRSEGRDQESDLRSKFFNADRVLNRFWDYPRFVRGRKSDFDLYHVVDHSYAQLLHNLPADRTVVSCHDLDTFRCLLEPDKEPRSKIFRMMMTHVLNGIRKAARVTCVSAATRDQVLKWKLLPPERVVVIPNGVHPICRPEPDPAADAEATRLLAGGPADTINILHVGSTIRRKRIDVLLEIFAGVRKEFPSVRLVRVGGPFTPGQLKLVQRLKLEKSIVVLPHLSREVLAAIYRQAILVLLPSDGEGFGLPVIEAMACGTPVVASDLSVLREVGGDAASYSSVADVPAWIASVNDLLWESSQNPEKWDVRRVAGIAQAAKFSWAEYTQEMVGLYGEVLK
jgi:glycosyltransferase involved in cell wall biosynthesis